MLLKVTRSGNAGDMMQDQKENPRCIRSMKLMSQECVNLDVAQCKAKTLGGMPRNNAEIRSAGK